jgi:hypothetical protein
MNRFNYRVYYEFNGPSKGNPFRSLKSDKQVEDALCNFAHELRLRLSDTNAVVTGDPIVKGIKSIHITVETSLDRDAVNAAMKPCLNDLDLFGGIL